MGLPPAAQASGTARSGDRAAGRRRVPAVEQHRAARAGSPAGHRRPRRRARRGPVVLTARVWPARPAAPCLDGALPRERAACGGVHPAALPLVRRRLGGPALQRDSRCRRRGHDLPDVHPVPLARAAPGGIGRVHQRRGRLPDRREDGRPAAAAAERAARGAVPPRRHRRRRPPGNRRRQARRHQPHHRRLTGTAQHRLFPRSPPARSPAPPARFRGTGPPAQDTSLLRRPYYQAGDE